MRTRGSLPEPQLWIFFYSEPDSELKKSEGLVVQAKLPGRGPLQAALTHRQEHNHRITDW